MGVNVADMRAVAKQAREYLSDPDRVVLDPEHLYEDNEGVGTMRRLDGEPDRMCFMGALCVAADHRPYLWMRTADALAHQAGVDNLTVVLRDDGAEGCVAVIDRYLAATDD
jgi:hypothetical protein